MIDLIDTCSKNCDSPVCRDGVRGVSDGPPGLSLVSPLPVSEGNWLIMDSHKETPDKYDETQYRSKKEGNKGMQNDYKKFLKRKKGYKGTWNNQREMQSD